MKALVAIAAGALLLVPRPAHGEGPPDPEIGYVFPAGGRAGTAVDVRLGIYEWTPDLQYFVHDPRVKLEVLGQPGPLLMQERPHAIGKKAYNPPPLPREVPARFIIPVDAPAGPIRWQVANANGSSRTGVFIVSHSRELVENEESAAPQGVGDLPVTISGRLRRNEEIDRFRVRRRSSGLVTCELFARRLGSPFHGAIEVRDAGGTRVADAVDTRGRDVECTFFAQANTDYTISVHDLDFLGNRAFVYRLALSAGPRLVAAIPAAYRDGPSASVELIGVGTATGAARLERVRREVPCPDDPNQRTNEYRLETPFGRSRPIAIDVPPRRTAPLTPAHTVATASGTIVDVPFHLTTEFVGTARVHRYRFAAKQGERFALLAASRVIGPPVDLSLAVAGSDGQEQAHNDDLPGTLDAGLEFAAAVDGVFTAVVTDLSESGPLPHVYRLSIERPDPDFALDVPQRIPIVIGGKADLPIKVERRGGFNAPIRLAVQNLPHGVRAEQAPSGLVIPPDKNEWKIALAADQSAPAAASTIRITGTADVAGRKVVRTATALTADNLAPAAPAEVRVPQVLVTALLGPRVRIWPVESDERTVNRGTVHLAELGIERLEGFDGPVLLQMESRQPNKFRQGVWGPDVLVPAGQTRVLYPCFVGEESETVDAYRVSVNALARVHDARGNEHWLVSNMRSQVSIALTVEGGLLKLSADAASVQARPGTTVAMPVRILRSPRLPEPVTVRAIVPPALARVISVDPIQIPVNSETGTVAVRIAAGAPPGIHILRLEAAATQPARLPAIADGLQATPLAAEHLELLARGLLPVLSETDVTIELLAK